MKFLHIFISSSLSRPQLWRGGEKQFYQFLLNSKEENFVACPKDSQLFEKLKLISLFIPVSGFWSFIKLHYLIKKKHIQTIIAHDSKAHNYGLILKFLNKKVRLVVHRRVYRLKQKKKFKFKTSLVDAFIGVSHFIKKNLIHTGVNPKKIFVVYDFFLQKREHFLFEKEKEIEKKEIQKMESLSLSSHPSKMKICYLATFNHQKNHKFLIHSLKILKKRNIPFVCFLAGQGKLQPYLQNLSIRLGLENEIHFLGRLLFVRHLLKVCDVMVFPAINEALGSSLIEGAYEHCLLIGARSGGVPEFIREGETGLLFDPSSEEDLAQKLIDYSKNPEIKEKFTKNALRLIEKEFDPKKQHEKLVKLYSNEKSD